MHPLFALILILSTSSHLMTILVWCVWFNYMSCHNNYTIIIITLLSTPCFTFSVAFQLSAALLNGCYSVVWSIAIVPEVWVPRESERLVWHLSLYIAYDIHIMISFFSITVTMFCKETSTLDEHGNSLNYWYENDGEERETRKSDLITLRQGKKRIVSRKK